MNEYGRQSEFIKQLLGFDESPLARALQERLTSAERNERCLYSSCRLVALIGVLGVMGFGYTAVLLPEFFDKSHHVFIRLFSALTLGSALCLVVFAGVWAWYRAAASRVREECRKIILQALNRRLHQNTDHVGPVVQNAPYASIVPQNPRPIPFKPEADPGFRRAV